MTATDKKVHSQHEEMKELHKEVEELKASHKRAIAETQEKNEEVWEDIKDSLRDEVALGLDAVFDADDLELSIESPDPTLVQPPLKVRKTKGNEKEEMDIQVTKPATTKSTKANRKSKAVSEDKQQVMAGQNLNVFQDENKEKEDRVVAFLGTTAEMDLSNETFYLVLILPKHKQLDRKTNTFQGQYLDIHTKNRNGYYCYKLLSTSRTETFNLRNIIPVDIVVRRGEKLNEEYVLTKWMVQKVKKALPT